MCWWTFLEARREVFAHLISFAFGEQFGGGGSIQMASPRTLLLWGNYSSCVDPFFTAHFGGRRSRGSAPTSSCFYRSFAAKAQQCLNWIPAAEKMMDVRSHFFTVRLLLSPCMEKPSGTSFPHPVKWNVMLFIQKRSASIAGCIRRKGGWPSYRWHVTGRRRSVSCVERREEGSSASMKARRQPSLTVPDRLVLPVMNGSYGIESAPFTHLC